MARHRPEWPPGMHPLTIIAATAVALLSFGTSLASDSDGSLQADRALERSIVAKPEPLDHLDLRSLSSVSSRRLLEDATLDRVTRKMAAGLDLREARWVESLFATYQKAARLPEHTFRFLVNDMTAVGPSSYVAADALKTLAETDGRRSIALAALAEAMTAESDDKRALSLLAHIERFDRHGPLTRDAVAAVATLAASDRGFSLRKRAIKLLLEHDLSADERLGIYRSLLTEIDTGLDLYSKESMQIQYRNRELSYVLEMLTVFTPRPYPPELIDLLTVNFTRHAALGLPVIVEFRRASELSERQHVLLARWAIDYAASIFSQDYLAAMAMRLELFRVLWPEPTGSDAQAAIATFENEQDEGARRKALYDIKRFYGDGVIPGPVVDRLHARLLGPQSEEFRFVGATLVLGSDMAFSSKEEMILALIAQRSREDQLYSLLLDQYDTSALQAFVAAHAMDKALPASFRGQAIRRLGLMAEPGQQLSAETAAALKETVLLDTDIGLGTAETTLSEWGVEPPVSERQQVREHNETMANIAGIITLVFTLVSPVVFIIGLAVIPMAVSLHRGGILRRSVSLIGWVLYGGVVFLAWVFAVFGSYGIHGSGAPLERHFAIMAPFHIASVIGLIVLIWCVLRLVGTRGGADLGDRELGGVDTNSPS